MRVFQQNQKRYLPISEGSDLCAANPNYTDGNTLAQQRCGKHGSETSLYAGTLGIFAYNRRKVGNVDRLPVHNNSTQ